MPQHNTTHAGIASFVDGESYSDVALFTGERQVHTDTGIFAAGQELPAHSVLARNASGELVLAEHGQTAVAISMTEVHAGAETVSAPVYFSGCFNPERLHFHASFDTEAKQMSAFGEPSDKNIALKKMRG